MTLGRYVNNDTFLTRLDPRNKFVLLFLFMVVIFLINPTKQVEIDGNIYTYQIFGWICYFVMLIGFIILYKIAKLKFSMIFKSLKPMWIMMIFLLIINIFIYKEGPVLFSIKSFSVYVSALTQTFKIVLRLVLLITLSTLFTATTKPLDITIALDDLFAWLKIFHINVSIVSMTISIALRFIPTILDETYRIMKAQASRGVDFKNGKLKEKAIAITSLIIPLFISAISRSDELANAMEARNYNPLAKRTRYRKLKWHLKDTISMLLSFIILGGSIAIVVLFNNHTLGIILEDSWWINIFNNIVETIKGWF